MNKILTILFLSLMLLQTDSKAQDYWEQAKAAYRNENDTLVITLLDSLLNDFKNSEGPICGSGVFAWNSSIAVLKATSYLRLKDYRACREAITVNAIVDLYDKWEADSLIIRSVVEQYGNKKGKKLLQKATLNCKLQYGKDGIFVYFKLGDEQIRIYKIIDLIETYYPTDTSLEGFGQYWRNEFLKQLKNFK